METQGTKGKIEIREVKEGSKGPLLVSRIPGGKFNLINGCNPKTGDVATARLIEVKDKAKVYACTPIPPDRMVVRLWKLDGQPLHATVWWQGRKEEAHDVAYLRKQAEVITEHFYGQGQGKMILVKEGFEKEVYQRLKKAQFETFLIETLGLFDTLANAEITRKGRKTEEECCNYLMANKPSYFKQKEWDIVMPHLAKFLALKSAMIVIYEDSSKITDELKPYIADKLRQINISQFVLPFLAHLGRFETLGDITRENVMKLLEEVAITYPEVPD